MSDAERTQHMSDAEVLEDLRARRGAPRAVPADERLTLRVPLWLRVLITVVFVGLMSGLIFVVPMLLLR